MPKVTWPRTFHIFSTTTRILVGGGLVVGVASMYSTDAQTPPVYDMP